MLAPTYDTFHEPADGTNERRLSVKVVDCMDDLLKVLAIRAATYISEQQCPYGEDVDGNDYCAMHLLGYVADEPAGCVRMRFFADFVKVERLAVRAEFRKTRLAFRLARAAIDLAAKKGFKTIYGHSRERVDALWGRFGGRPLEKQRDVIFSGLRFIETLVPIPPDPSAITLKSNPYVILRTEGQWHRPGIMEESAKRPPTNVIPAQ